MWWLKGRVGAAIAAGTTIATFGYHAYHSICSAPVRPCTSADLLEKDSSRTKQPNLKGRHNSRKRKATGTIEHGNVPSAKRTRSEPIYPASKATRISLSKEKSKLQTLTSNSDNSSGRTGSEDLSSICSAQTSHTCSSSGPDELVHFRHVIGEVDFEKLKTVALRVRRQVQQDLHESTGDLYVLPDDLTCDIDEDPRHGTFNLVYTILFSDGLRWVARLPGHGDSFDGLDKVKMDSEYQSMRYIRRSTTVPMRDVYYWNPDATEIGSAFALMNFVHGFPLHHLWDTTFTDHECRRTLSDVARHMSQLQRLRYDQSGILGFSEADSTPSIRPQIYFASSHSDDNEVPWGESYEDELYSSYAEQLRGGRDDCKDFKYKRLKCDMPILDLAIESIPSYMDSECVKAIHMPDLNLHNIIVDKNGTIVAFLDWDMVGVFPTRAGCAKFPPWISEDWLAPVKFEYDNEGDGESDETVKMAQERLSSYRKYYVAVYARYAACQVDDYDPRTTTASHILEAIDSALTHRFSRASIVCKLLEHASGGEPPFTLADYANAFEADNTERYDDMLREAFSTMWHAEWEMKDALADEGVIECVRGRTRH